MLMVLLGLVGDGFQYKSKENVLIIVFPLQTEE